MLRISTYADRLVEDLDNLQCPEPIKKMQQDWVGRSEGAEVDFFIGQENDFQNWIAGQTKSRFLQFAGKDVIRIYTTRPDTLFGATYMVLAPEHSMVDKLTTNDNREKVDSYRQRVAATSEEDRIAGRGEKNGVFTGGYAINPVTGEKIPVWIADYVLISYGTGAIMAVPGHDQRDLEFASAFHLPVRAVVMPSAIGCAACGKAEGNATEPLTTGNFAADGGLPEAFVDDGLGMQSKILKYHERTTDAHASKDYRMARQQRNRARGRQV
jgi:leucyl-tRNA synthetase